MNVLVLVVLDTTTINCYSHTSWPVAAVELQNKKLKSTLRMKKEASFIQLVKTVFKPQVNVIQGKNI